MNRSRRKQLRNFIGEFRVTVEGATHYAGNPLEAEPVTFVRESIGRRDACVIAVHDADGRKIGWLPRDVTHWLAPLLDSGVVAIDGMAPRRSGDADGSHFLIQIAAYAPRGAGKIFAPAGGRGLAGLVHSIIKQAYRKAQRETDPSAVADLAASVDPLARQELLPETRLLLELLRGLGREIRMARVVRAQSQLVRALANVEVLDAAPLAGLDVFPLRWRKPQESHLLPLNAAIDSGDAAISEVSADGNVPVLVLKNNAKRPILVPAGEVIVGLKQNCVVDLSLIAPPGKKTGIPLRCAERGRWAEGHRQAVESAAEPPTACSAGRSTLRDCRGSRDGFERNRLAARESVGLLEKATGIDSVTESLAGIRPNGALGWPIESLCLPDDASGICVAADGQVLSVDLLAAPEYLRPRLGLLLQSHTEEAMRRTSIGHLRQPVSAEAVRQFLQKLAGAARAAPAELALGDEFEFPGDSVAGGAIVHKGALAHLWAVSRPIE